jgi:hypothetical protein
MSESCWLCWPPGFVAIKHKSSATATTFLAGSPRKRGASIGSLLPCASSRSCANRCPFWGNPRAGRRSVRRRPLLRPSDSGLDEEARGRRHARRFRIPDDRYSDRLRRLLSFVWRDAMRQIGRSTPAPLAPGAEAVVRGRPGSSWRPSVDRLPQRGAKQPSPSPMCALHKSPVAQLCSDATKTPARARQCDSLARLESVVAGCWI